MSELGNLSRCIVDSDALAKSRARRLRRKALAASIAFEAVVVAGLIVWPLLTVAVLPSQAVVTPLPPFHGVRQQPVSPRSEHPGSTRPTNGAQQVFQPPRIPPHVAIGPGPEPPSWGGPNEPVGPGLPSGFDDGRPIEIVRPPQTQTRTVVRPAEFMEAMLVHRVQPEYPALARAIHLAGTVVLRARIGTDGEVHELETISGNALLARAARDAVRQWRYRPTMLNGQAVEVETQITVNYILNSD